jgi:sugar phosphate isomerase/epimerase
MTDARPLALQLWTVREAYQADPAAALRRAREAGFRAVEPYGVVGDGSLPADQRLARVRRVRRQLDDNGLVACSVHGPIPPDGEFELLFDELAELGTDTLIMPFPGEIAGVDAPLESADGMKAATERINACARAAASRGLTVGYHNHYHEFAPFPGGDGLTPWDVLWQYADPSVIAEVDVYWAQAGCGDAASVVARLGERATLLHVKDGPADTVSMETVLGEGVLDLDAILTAATHARWHIVELDDWSGEMFEGARLGARWLVDRGWSRWAVA